MAPHNAVKVWCEGDNLCVEYPSYEEPYVVKFPRTGEGLAKAYKDILARFENVPAEHKVCTVPVTVYRRQGLRVQSDASLTEVTALLRKRGMLK